MPPDKTNFDRYLLALRRTPLEEKTEHTDRLALETLLQVLADETQKGVKVQHEPKRIANKGAPDFKVTKSGLILGYVENKGIGEPLDKVLKSEQIAKYKTLSQNIIVTDYLHFAWINKDGIQRELLCHETDLENRRFRLREDRIDAVRSLLHAFFSTAPEGIGRAQQLALALATRSRLLRDYLGEELIRQEKEHTGGRLYGLFQVFRDQVSHELTLKEFADAFAQMLAYGLFLARLNSESKPVTLHNAREYVPGSFRLIRELVDFLSELVKDEYRDVRWVVEEVLSIVNGLDLSAIHEDLSFRQRKAISRRVRAADAEEHRLFERDPFIYFYEDYLKAYDRETRKSRGVYYTPPPIVNFIIRAIDDVLKESFSIHEGLADHKRVTVLDFACGTGTFLVEVFQRIFENIGGPESGSADLIVREHMLRNVFGFEYLIAPYTIAHLKLSQFLRDKDHTLNDQERLRVFLTNTLEPVEPIVNRLLPELTAETKAAQGIKEMPILVITGNPPYSGHSQNKGPWITASIEEYKFTWEKTVDGLSERKPLRERVSKWLHDDYVKFIRFAQMKMDGFTFTTVAPDGKLIEHSVDGVEYGIIGVITNHSWLDNPTFRGMRQSLMRSFEQIYVVDLHGNAKKKERAPDGSKDENVFEIEQGVAISIFVKRPGLERGVWRADVWGLQLEKYKEVASASMRTLEWNKVNPVAPYYLFEKQAEEMRAEFLRGVPVPEIFVIGGTGIITKRDMLAIRFSNEEMWETINKFAVADSNDAYREFGLPPDVRDWSVKAAQEDVRKSGPRQSLVKPLLYHPFDTRYTYYTGKSRGFLGWPVERVMSHMLSRNIALIVDRITKDEPSALVSDIPVAHKAATRYDISYSYPLTIGGAENFSREFRDFIDDRYEHHYTPEEILGYIYAVLYAPIYRARYAEFLSIDFPRIPFPDTADGFEALSELGWELVEAHLMRNGPRKGLGKYPTKGDHVVEFVRYSPTEQSISISETQSFKPVPEAVWNFQIGGYQVLDRYLKSRKGRNLSLAEISHVAAVADCLAFTIEQMAKIDKAYLTAFGQRG